MIICTYFPNGQDYILHLPVRQGIVQGNAENPFIKPFRFWAKPFRITKPLVIGQAVDRNIVYLTVDILSRHSVKKLASAAGEDIRIKLYHV